MAEPNVTPAVPFDPFAEFERMTASEGGGGGTIALCEISYGYKSYASQPQVETFFPFVPSPDDSNGQAAVAKASAEAYNTLHQCQKPVRLGVQIKALRDGALTKGKPVTWSVSARHFNTDGWTEACKDIVIPSLKANGITSFPWTGWARLGFKPDPYKEKMGITEDDGKGGQRTPLVAYVIETFAGEAEAHASAASDAPAPASPNGTEPAWKPESDGWKTEDLQAIGPQLVAEMTEVKDASGNITKAAKPLTQVAAEYSLSIGDALIALGVHRSPAPPTVFAERYHLDVEVISKVRDQASVIPF